MRRRFMRATMVLVLLAVVGLSLPISFLVRRVIRTEAVNRLQQEAEAVALSFSDQLRSGAPITEADLNNALPTTNDRIQLRLANGAELIAGPRSRFPAELSVTVRGPAGSQLTLSDDGSDTESRTRTATIVLFVTGFVVVATAAAVAWWEAGRLTRPLARVAASADHMGTGEIAAESPRSGMPEVDAVADALKRLAERVSELVRAEREFSSNASHQLRTALTSLRLRLETLAQTRHDDVREDAKAALAQAEKLSDTVADLLRLARTGRVGEASRYDLARVVRHHVARIVPAAHNVGREIRVHSAGASAEVLGSPNAVGEAVDVLLSNALAHGRGDIGVSIISEDGALVVTVADEGPGIADESLATLFVRRPDADGHGIGLALARTLIEAEGGRLELAQPRPPVFRLRLPARQNA